MRILPYSAAKADHYQPGQRGNCFTHAEGLLMASLCADLSPLAYCRTLSGSSFNYDRLNPVPGSIGIAMPAYVEGPRTFARGSTHYFIAIGRDIQYGRDIGVVVFRGTDAVDPMGIGGEADFRLTQWNGGRIIPAS